MFRGIPRLTWEEVLPLAAKAGLAGVEWNAVHVAPGALELGGRVRRRMAEAGLVVSSYGSYYRAGASGPEAPFEPVLATARELGAPLVRIWAGDRNAEEMEAEARRRIVEDLRRVADLAEAAGVEVGVEYHGNSLTNSPESAGRLMAETEGRALRFYWQPPIGAAPPAALESLRGVLPRLAHLHVFHWTGRPGDFRRHPLAEGRGPWENYLRLAAEAPGDRWALLEFTAGDSPAQMIEDAGVLAGLIAGIPDGG